MVIMQRFALHSICGDEFRNCLPTAYRVRSNRFQASAVDKTLKIYDDQLINFEKYADDYRDIGI